MTAFKYYYIPLGPVGLAGIVIQPTPDLLRLQQELIDAAGPYTVKTATAAAFYTAPVEPDIAPAVIDYIADFHNHVGKNFSPHVTIGLGLAVFLDAMLAAPFAAFTFSPVSASVYQFGNYGAARNRLKSFPAQSRGPPATPNQRRARFEQHMDAPGYPLYAGENLWTIMPAAYILKLHVATFEDFPPRQAPPDFNPGAMLEHAIKAGNNGV